MEQFPAGSTSSTGTAHPSRGGDTQRSDTAAAGASPGRTLHRKSTSTSAMMVLRTKQEKCCSCCGEYSWDWWLDAEMLVMAALVGIAAAILWWQGHDERVGGIEWWRIVSLFAASFALLSPARLVTSLGFYLVALCDCTEGCRSAVFLLFAFQGYSSMLTLVGILAWRFSYSVLGIAGRNSRTPGEGHEDTANLIDQWLGCIITIAVLLGFRNAMVRYILWGVLQRAASEQRQQLARLQGIAACVTAPMRPDWSWPDEEEAIEPTNTDPISGTQAAETGQENERSASSDASSKEKQLKQQPVARARQETESSVSGAPGRAAEPASPAAVSFRVATDGATPSPAAPSAGGGPSAAMPPSPSARMATMRRRLRAFGLSKGTRPVLGLGNTSFSAASPSGLAPSSLGSIGIDESDAEGLHPWGEGEGEGEGEWPPGIGGVADGSVIIDDAVEAEDEVAEAVARDGEHELGLHQQLQLARSARLRMYDETGELRPVRRADTAQLLARLAFKRACRARDSKRGRVQGNAAVQPGPGNTYDSRGSSRASSSAPADADGASKEPLVQPYPPNGKASGSGPLTTTTAANVGGPQSHLPAAKVPSPGPLDAAVPALVGPLYAGVHSLFDQPGPHRGLGARVPGYGRAPGGVLLEMTGDDFAALVWDQEAAEEAFAFFDVSEDGVVTQDEFEDGFVRLLQAFSNAQSVLAGHNTVSHAMDRFADFVYGMVAIAVFMMFFNIPATTLFVPLGSVLLPLSFALSSAISNALTSFVYVVAQRPYDVGDRVHCEKIAEDEVLEVEHIAILQTVFRKVHSGKEVTVPNQVLAFTPIENLKRSPDVTFTIDVDVGRDTTAQQLSELKRVMLGYLAEHPREWKPDLTLSALDALPGEGCMLRIRFWVRPRKGWQDWNKIYKVRSGFVVAMLAAMQEAGLEFKLPTQPVRLDRAVSLAAAEAAGQGPKGWSGAGIGAGRKSD